MSKGRSRRPSVLVIVAAVAVVVIILRCLTGAAASGALAAGPQDSAGTWLSDPNGLLSADHGVTRELILRTLVSLGIVVGLGVAAAVAIRRWGPRLSRIQGKQIRVIETTALGPKKALHIVEVGQQRFLIGSSSEQVTLLSQIPRQAAAGKTESAEPGRGM